jgi:hypothetical protein
MHVDPEVRTITTTRCAKKKKPSYWMLKSTMLGMLHIDGLARYCSPRHIHGGVEVMEVEKNKSGSDAGEQVLQFSTYTWGY